MSGKTYSLNNNKFPLEISNLEPKLAEELMKYFTGDIIYNLVILISSRTKFFRPNIIAYRPYVSVIVLKKKRT